MITDEERAGLINAIQALTRGTTIKERIFMAKCWEFMASELRRVCDCSAEPEPRQHQPRQQQSLE